MKLSDAPSFQYYAKDHMAATNGLSSEATACYFRWMTECWIKKSLPADSKRLAKLANLEDIPAIGFVAADFAKGCMEQFCREGFFAAVLNESGDVIEYEMPMLNELFRKQKKYRTKQSSNAKARWQRPSDVCHRIATALPNECQTDANNTHSGIAMAMPIIEDGVGVEEGEAVRGLEPKTQTPTKPTGEPDASCGDLLAATPVVSTAEEYGFPEFWKAYPRGEGKAVAKRSWLKLRPSRLLREQILAALERQKATPDWQKEGGRFVPHAATWINQRRWEDEPEKTASAAQNRIASNPRFAGMMQRGQPVAVPAGIPAVVPLSPEEIPF